MEDEPWQNASKLCGGNPWVQERQDLPIHPPTSSSIQHRNIEASVSNWRVEGTTQWPSQERPRKETRCGWTKSKKERLNQLLRFDPETQAFFWRQARRGSIHAGHRAGAKSKDYRLIRVDGAIYHSSELLTMLELGSLPTPFSRKLYCTSTTGQRGCTRVKSGRSSDLAFNRIAYGEVRFVIQNKASDVAKRRNFWGSLLMICLSQQNDGNEASNSILKMRSALNKLANQIWPTTGFSNSVRSMQLGVKRLLGLGLDMTFRPLCRLVL